MNLRRFLLAFLVAFCLTQLIQACATTGPNGSEGWDSWPRWFALPPVYKQVTAGELRAKCHDGPHFRSNACAVRDYSVGLCWIYSAGDMPQWLKDHEEKHCRGYDHAPPAIIAQFH